MNHIDKFIIIYHYELENIDLCAYRCYLIDAHIDYQLC